MNAEGKKWLRCDYAPKILYVDDERYALDALSYYLKSRFDLEIETALTIDEARTKLAAENPDIILVDLHMNDGTTGFKLIEEVYERPKPKVIIFSSRCDEYCVFHALQFRVSGYVYKSNGMDALVKAIESVLHNRRAFCWQSLEIEAEMAKDPSAFGRITSRRERELLAAVSCDLTDAQIGVTYDLKGTSVGYLRRRWARRFNISTRRLVAFLRDRGFDLAKRLRRARRQCSCASPNCGCQR